MSVTVIVIMVQGLDVIIPALFERVRMRILKGYDGLQFCGSITAHTTTSPSLSSTS